VDVERWQCVRHLFDQIADAHPDEWPQRLIAACPDDPDLRAEVQALLEADVAARGDTVLAARAPDLLDRYAEESDARADDAWTGRRLGAWRLIRIIGRGGMGRVYLAERDDAAYRQQAAIKLVRSGVDHEDVVRRFRTERQMLANLQHPNIAHLLDGGVTEEGVPWLALDYIDGIGLTEWCDRERLGIRERLRLFLDVCAAVAYAHERLIVHRDLKPGNILVDSDGRIKLLDFGIARLLDGENASATSVGELALFTPEYAAPEQIRGEPATTAVDIHALGVILCELLTGLRPYRSNSATANALAHAILTQEPTRPSRLLDATSESMERQPIGEIAAKRGTTLARLRGALGGDLDAIVMKALRKEPERRYRTVRELADDVRATLDRRPVLARHGGRRYRLSRFLKRHALPAALAAIAMTTLIVGMIAALWQAQQARQQRDMAQASLEFMTGLFENADPGVNNRADLTVRDLLDQGVRNIRHSLIGRGPERADILLAMAKGYLGTFSSAAAAPLIAEALGTYRRIGDAAGIADALLLNCSSFQSEGKLDECQPLLEEIEATLVESNPEHLPFLVKALDFRAIHSSHHDRHEEAIAHARRALSLLPKTQETLRQRGDLSGTLVFSLSELGRFEEVLDVMQPLVEEMRAAESLSPRVLADALDNYATTLARTDRVEEAIGMQREALAIMEDLYGQDSPVIVTKLNNLSVTLHRAGKLEEAYSLASRSVALRKVNSELDSSYAVNALSNLGALAFLLKRDSDAVAHLDESIALADTASNVSPRYLGVALGWRASVMLALGRLADARSDLSRSRAVLLSSFPLDHPRLLRIRAMTAAIDIAEHGPNGRPDAACVEARSVSNAYAQLAADSKTDSETAFATFLDELCAPRANAIPADSRSLEAAFSKLEDQVEVEDFRLRQARTVLASLKPGTR
jgi:serine/threonine-protein kinase